MIVMQTCHVAWRGIAVPVLVEVTRLVARMVVMLTTSLLRHFRSPREGQSFDPAAFQVQSQLAETGCARTTVDRPLIHHGIGLRSDPQIGLECPPALGETGPRLIVGQRRHDDHVFSWKPVGRGRHLVRVSKLQAVDRS